MIFRTVLAGALLAAALAADSAGEETDPTGPREYDASTYTVLGTLVSIQDKTNREKTEYILAYRDPQRSGVVAGKWSGIRPRGRDGGEFPPVDTPTDGIPRADTLDAHPDELQWLLPNPTAGGRDGVPMGLMRAILDGEKAAIQGMIDPAHYERKRAEVIERISGRPSGDRTVRIQDYTVQLTRFAKRDGGDDQVSRSLDVVSLGKGKTVLLDPTHGR